MFDSVRLSLHSFDYVNNNIAKWWQSTQIITVKWLWHILTAMTVKDWNASTNNLLLFFWWMLSKLYLSKTVARWVKSPPCCLCLHHSLASCSGLSLSPLTLWQSALFNNTSYSWFCKSALKRLSRALWSIWTHTHTKTNDQPIETNLCCVSLSVVSCPLTSVCV